MMHFVLLISYLQVVPNETQTEDVNNSKDLLEKFSLTQHSYCEVMVVSELDNSCISHRNAVMIS